MYFHNDTMTLYYNIKLKTDDVLGGLEFARLALIYVCFFRYHFDIFQKHCDSSPLDYVIPYLDIAL